MPTKKEEPNQANDGREAVRDRVKFLLDYRWDGNQRGMAEDLGVSQGLISKIVNGFQGAGPRFLAVLGRQPGVNAQWLQGEGGQPLNLPEKGSLPIALGLLPGSPLDYPHLLTGERHPIAEPMNRISRYLLKLQPDSGLVENPASKLLPGDLLLVETAREWIGRLDLNLGRVCGIRIVRMRQEPSYELGWLRREDGTVFMRNRERTARLVEPALNPPLQPSSTIHSEGATPTPRRRRTIRNLERAAERAKRREETSESATQTTEQEDVFTLDEIVGTCVYVIRPDPVLA